MAYPLVSILIPTFNREHLIGESIQSALEQNYPSIEVIVVDNASTDGTWEIIKKFAENHPQIRAFRNPSNIGPVRNWIECARHAKGAYSKILWSDDLIDSNFISRTISFLDDINVGFVYTSARIFSNPDSALTAPLSYDHLATGVYDSKRFIEGSLLGTQFPVSPGCAIMRTVDLQKNLLIDIPNSIGSDFSNHAIGNDLLLLLLTAQSYTKFATVNEPLSMFRAHSGSISVSSAKGRLFIHYDIARAYFVQKHINDENLQERFNAVLWHHKKKFNGKQYGVNKIEDFYPEPTNTKIKFNFLFSYFINRLRNSLL